MNLRLRKSMLTVHIACSVGWLGAVVAYLVIAIQILPRADAQRVHAAYLAMEQIGWFALVPLSVAALVSGVIQSLGTEWGLFRYYWVVAKFALTLVATIILFAHLPSVSRMAGSVAETTNSGGGHGQATHPLHFVAHAAGGLVVLLGITALSVFKPWGRTPWGKE